MSITNNHGFGHLNFTYSTDGSCVWTGADEAAVHTVELHLYLIFINIITSKFLYYACKGPLVKL